MIINDKLIRKMDAVIQSNYLFYIVDAFPTVHIIKDESDYRSPVTYLGIYLNFNWERVILIPSTKPEQYEFSLRRSGGGKSYQYRRQTTKCLVSSSSEGDISQTNQNDDFFGLSKSKLLVDITTLLEDAIKRKFDGRHFIINKDGKDYFIVKEHHNNHDPLHLDIFLSTIDQIKKILTDADITFAFGNIDMDCIEIPNLSFKVLFASENPIQNREGLRNWLLALHNTKTPCDTPEIQV